MFQEKKFKLPGSFQTSSSYRSSTPPVTLRGEGDQAGHPGRQLRAVRGVIVHNREVMLRLIDRRSWESGQVCCSVVDDQRRSPGRDDQKEQKKHGRESVLFGQKKIHNRVSDKGSDLQEQKGAVRSEKICQKEPEKKRERDGFKRPHQKNAVLSSGHEGAWQGEPS